MVNGENKISAKKNVELYKVCSGKRMVKTNAINRLESSKEKTNQGNRAQITYEPLRKNLSRQLKGSHCETLNVDPLKGEKEEGDKTESARTAKLSHSESGRD